MSIAVKEAEIIEEFEMLDNWQDRFQIVIDTGETLPPMPEEPEGAGEEELPPAPTTEAPKLPEVG